MRTNRLGRFFQQNQYVIASLVLFLAIAGMTGVYVANRINGQRQEIAQRQQAELDEQLALQEEQDRLEEESVESVNSIIQPEETPVIEKAKKEEADQPAEETKPVEEEVGDSKTQEETKKAEVTGSSALHFNPESDLNWPLEGDIILNYSMDQTVYFATLDQYKYNPALVIAGEVNAPVYAAASGRVTSIVQNEETGTTLTMELGDGYSAVYGQLKEVLYKEGAFVESGNAIGYVAEPTKYYSVEGSNLYFQLLKDGEPVDPMKYME